MQCRRSAEQCVEQLPRHDGDSGGAVQLTRAASKDSGAAVVDGGGNGGGGADSGGGGADGGGTYASSVLKFVLGNNAVSECPQPLTVFLPGVVGGGAVPGRRPCNWQQLSQQIRRHVYPIWALVPPMEICTVGEIAVE